MTQKELIDFWRTGAAHDIDAVDNLFTAGNYDWALFIGHLVVEKILKARLVLDNKDGAPPQNTQPR